MKICLGIDAGGTFTDVAAVDLDSGRVLEKAKEPTSRPSPAYGIAAAIQRIGTNYRKQAKLVALSTTLATNAIVEGKGQEVGLFVMPPYGRLEPDNFTHFPKAVIEGQMDIDGTELVPINERQIRELARRFIGNYHVSAFAVAGFAGHVNPSHELEVKRIIHDETGLPVTCGHDISEGVNYRIRAETAALNAKIMPYIVNFMDIIRQTLAGYSINAPIMIVKSDGSLMALKAALEKPVHTILSGPAASVAGACYLADLKDAVIIDIGGTTSDIALVKNGEVPVCREGAIVGGWHTNIAGVAMRTCGLGGDSAIRFINGNLQIGPQRIVPAGMLAREYGNIAVSYTHLTLPTIYSV